MKTPIKQNKIANHVEAAKCENCFQSFGNESVVVECEKEHVFHLQCFIAEDKRDCTTCQFAMITEYDLGYGSVLLSPPKRSRL